MMLNWLPWAQEGLVGGSVTLFSPQIFRILKAVCGVCAYMCMNESYQNESKTQNRVEQT